MTQRPGAAHVVRLAVLGAIWGASFLCTEIALRGWPPFSVAALRVLLGALMLLAFAASRGLRLPRYPGTWLLLLIVGFLNSALPFFLISWGQQFVAPGASAILMASSPMIALLMAHVVTRDDRINGAKALGVALGFAGVLVLIGAEALAGLTGGVLGQLAIVTACVCYVASSLIARRLRELPPLDASALVLTVTAAYLVPLALWLYPLSRYPVEPTTWTALLFLGLAATGLGYLVRFQLIQQVGTTFLSQVAYLIPPFAMLWAWLFLGDSPDARSWVALALIFAGVFCGQRGGARLTPAAPENVARDARA